MSEQTPEQKAAHAEWAALKKAANDRGWPTTAFDYGHEPESQEEAAAWKHWDEGPSWKCNECGHDATDGARERATFLAGTAWRDAHLKVPNRLDCETVKETFRKALTAVMNQPFNGDWDAQAAFVSQVLCEAERKVDL